MMTRSAGRSGISIALIIGGAGGCGLLGQYSIDEGGGGQGGSAATGGFDAMTMGGNGGTPGAAGAGGSSAGAGTGAASGTGGTAGASGLGGGSGTSGAGGSAGTCPATEPLQCPASACPDVCWAADTDCESVTECEAARTCAACPVDSPPYRVDCAAANCVQGTGGTGGSGGAGGAGTTCGGFSVQGSTACRDCYAQNCCATGESCGASPSCNSLRLCTAAGFANFNTCASMYPGGVSQYLAVQECFYAKCASACALSSQLGGWCAADVTCNGFCTSTTLGYCTDVCLSSADCPGSSPFGHSMVCSGNPTKCKPACTTGSDCSPYPGTTCSLGTCG